MNKLIPIEIQNLTSAWSGHANFAIWLVEEIKPNIIVDLGVDNGFSTFIWSVPKIGKVYGVDVFKPYGKSKRVTLPKVEKLKETLDNKYGMQVEIIVGDTIEVSERWTQPIDILHIDANHHYEAVKKDFDNWRKFVKEDGVILMHDTNSHHSGPKKLFKEINMPKKNFKKSGGLGVLSNNKELMKKIGSYNG